MHSEGEGEGFKSHDQIIHGVYMWMTLFNMIVGDAIRTFNKESEGFLVSAVFSVDRMTQWLREWTWHQIIHHLSCMTLSR